MLRDSILGPIPEVHALRRGARWLLEIAVFAGIYVLGAMVGFALVFDTWISAIWPPSGISLGLLLIGGYRLWPAVIIGSLASNLIGLSDRDAPTVAAVAVAGGIAIGNTVQAVLGAFLIRRFCSGKDFFDRAPSVLAFVALGPLLSTMISATVGVGLLTSSGLVPTTELFEAWSSWWLGNVMGDLVCTPLILTWQRLPQLRWSQLTEGMVVLVLLTIVGALVFGAAHTELSRYPLVYLPLPLVGWAAFRFGQHGAVTATALLTTLAVSGTVSGRGVFVQGTMAESLFLLQTFVGIVSVTALALAATVNERGQKEEALREAHDGLEGRVAERTAELRALSTRLESVREEERKHIAREIHDELGQLLTALKIDLFWLQKRTDPALRAKTAGMVEFVESMIRVVRRIATELRPSVLDHLGLVKTLEWQMQDFEARTGVACSFDVMTDECPLDAGLSIEVFRVVQEALTNVARHADAKRVELKVSYSDTHLCVEISDDGIGLPNGAGESGSLGLVGMRERAARCGGRIDIAGQPGRGTTVRIEVPLTAEEGRQEQYASPSRG